MNKDDWIIGKTFDGQYYYHNKLTKKSQWKNPFGNIEPKLEKSIWKIGVFNNGKIYYYNKITKKSQWKCPFNIEHIWSVGQFIDGKIYYYNRLTKISQWENPFEKPMPPVPPATPIPISRYIFIPTKI